MWDRSKDIDFDAYIRGERPPNYRTTSGIELKEFYTAEDAPSRDERPGQYPFTRGIHADMYRRRFWTRRQQTGYGSPRESNERMRLLLKEGQTGLNVNLDVPGELGLDADHPLAQGDIGLVGTSLSTLEDAEELFRDLPLDKISTTIILPPPSSAVLMALYLLLAERQGVSPSSLMGTIMNDSFNQLVGPTREAVLPFFPIDASVKIGVDVMEYCTRQIPKWNILNINAYNMRQTGIDAVQEGAFAMSLARDYIGLLLQRGLDIDEFAGRIAFFCDVQMDFLEEIAKIRAMRRLWAKMIREDFGAKETRSCLFKAAVQTSGLHLTAQQPLNNIARATIQTLAAVLAGVQSIHTTSYDEAYALPTEDAQKLSIRIQQIIGYETGLTKVVDPLGGAYVIEWLTDALEERMLALMRRIEDMGGFMKCYKDGWIENEINKARYEMSGRIERGEQVVVGVNAFRDEEEKLPISIFKVYSSEMQRARIEYVKRYKKERDQKKVENALSKLYEETKKGSNVLPPVMDAVLSRATLGEICDTLRRAYGFEIQV